MKSGDGDGGPPHTSWRLLALVAFGGALGAPARWALALNLQGASSGWPTATFLTNLAGAFALGLVVEALARLGPDTGARRGTRLAVGTGFLGAFTTYSSFALEVDGYLRAGNVALGAGYAAATVAGGLAAAAAGVAVGSLVRRTGAAGGGRR
ncbi:CrcB protein [Quadrisphaera granulorum]|uniref:Fluoride-specific ion channel FluC n=1 Tax=Quadrisphaera granulorum TaxID=317664 RepID=A0A316ADE9_9ACTN|nr:CrcB family protein [Quadrisphaera granulorum]PWJ55439.1 CrcB protein [Quadrisphaera granulorum]SZE95503.1 CrcB protein [Quadrisphaera granulorum]